MSGVVLLSAAAGDPPSTKSRRAVLLRIAARLTDVGDGAILLLTGLAIDPGSGDNRDALRLKKLVLCIRRKVATTFEAFLSPAFSRLAKKPSKHRRKGLSKPFCLNKADISANNTSYTSELVSCCDNQ